MQDRQAVGVRLCVFVYCFVHSTLLYSTARVRDGQGQQAQHRGGGASDQPQSQLHGTQYGACKALGRFAGVTASIVASHFPVYLSATEPGSIPGQTNALHIIHGIFFF